MEWLAFIFILSRCTDVQKNFFVIVELETNIITETSENQLFSKFHRNIRTH